MRRKAVWMVVALALLAAPAAAQPPPSAFTFPAAGMEAIDALYRGVDSHDDAARRIAIRRTCEKMSLDLGTDWGAKKRAGLSDDFISPDSIAVKENDGTISVWDIQTSSGAIDVFAGKPPNYTRLPRSEAEFIPCLGAPTPGPPPPPPGPGPTPPPPPGPPPPPPLDTSPLATHEDVARLERRFDGVEQKVDAILNKMGAWESLVKSKWTYITSGFVLMFGERMNWFGTNPPAEVP